MFEIDIFLKILENQGLVAMLLAYMILQSNKEKAVLLSKICELNHFIMQLLKDELCEDHNGNDKSSVASQNAQHDTHYAGGVIIPQEEESTSI